MKSISAFLSGLLFGLGLIVAGMANPAKVLSFLDIFGNWDPSLAFVMIGGIAVTLVAFTIVKHRQQSLLGNSFNLPTKTTLDKRLIIGSLVFGIGWGLAGVCPGPGLVLLGMGHIAGIVFVGAMLLGMFSYELLNHK